MGGVMTNLDTRKWVRAAAASGSAAALATFPRNRPPNLSPAALEVAEKYAPPGYSPIVVAGIVRLVEFALVALVGFAAYAAYVVPSDGFEWYYVGTILGISALSTV